MSNSTETIQALPLQSPVTADQVDQIRKSENRRALADLRQRLPQLDDVYFPLLGTVTAVAGQVDALLHYIDDRIRMLGMIQDRAAGLNAQCEQLRALLTEILRRDDAAFAELRQLGLEPEAITVQLTERIRQTLAGVSTP